MRRKLILAVLILLAFVLQGTVFQTLSIASIVPNLLLILTVSFGFMRGKRTGIWTGFVCGLCCDLLGDGILGYYALIYLLIGFGAGCCCKLFYDDELRVPVLIVAVCDLVYGGMVYVLGFLLHGRIQFFYYFSRMMIPEMIYTVLLTAILYKVFLKINKKLTELEMKERDSNLVKKIKKYLINYA